MGEKSDQFPLYEESGFTFEVKDDGMLGSLTGFSLDYQKGFARMELVLAPLYD